MNAAFRYLVIAAALCCCSAFAADFPTKPVTLVAPSVPGGAVDSSARLLGDRLSQKLGQRFVVENKPGANGAIGAAAVARAPGDGYTLLFTQNTPLVLAPHISRALSYDVFSDFVPVIEVGRIQLVLVATPALQATTLRGFIDAAKASPGKISYASGGEGSDHHLAMELLRLTAGIQLHHVPYKAGPQGFADLLGGHVPVMFIAPGTAARHVKEGKLVALGVASNTPIPSYPGVRPISAELPGYEYESWFALLAPKGTPADVVGKLNAEFGAALVHPEVTPKMQSIGLVSRPTTPEDMARVLREDYEKIGKLAKAINLQPR